MPAGAARRKIKIKKKIIYLIDPINCLLIINRINYFDPLNSQINFLIFFAG
ncbi:MAG: hypothetical protein MPL62_04735 [Alphaproteobacteria bacterium]|nr:hypothetical protein [Alphaproteobacteria bacterium]